jgi:iron complex transport system permease protein
LKRITINLRNTLLVTSSLFLILVIVSLISISIGSTDIGFNDVMAVFLNLIGLSPTAGISDVQRAVVLDIRLPRVLLAILVGSGLSVSGVVFQALLRNPLAEPYILGISGGAAVGALMAIGFGFTLFHIGTPLAAFCGALIVVLAVYTFGKRHGRLDTNTLLLSGVMIGAFLSAIILFLVSVIGQPIRNALLWLLGNLGNADMISVLVITPVVFLASIGIYLHARNFNLIATGEEVAMQLGVDVESVKKRSYFFASLLTGSVVALSGAIGFVGLIIPHICRMMFGPDHRLLIPASFVMGAIFLVIVDVIARTVLFPIELPVGAVTAAVGAPFFIYLLKKS